MRVTKLILVTTLSCGLNLLIERLGLNPRWRYALWGVIALNEIRGIATVYWFGASALSLAGGG